MNIRKANLLIPCENHNLILEIHQSKCSLNLIIPESRVEAREPLHIIIHKPLPDWFLLLSPSRDEDQKTGDRRLLLPSPY